MGKTQLSPHSTRVIDVKQKTVRYLFAFLACSVCTQAAASPRKLPLSTQPKGVSITTLRSSDPICMIGRGRGGLELRHLNVEVRNVGRATAAAISVLAELGGGLSYPLKGPSKLDPGQTAMYFIRSRVPLLRDGRIRIVLRCATCRRS